MDNGFYSFRFDRLKFYVPYADLLVDISSPWSYLLSIGSCVVYLFLTIFIFPSFIPRAKHLLGKLHHSLLFFYSLFVFLAVLYHIIFNNEMTNQLKFYCEPVPGWLRLVSISFYSIQNLGMG